MIGIFFSNNISSASYEIGPFDPSKIISQSISIASFFWILNSRAAGMKILDFCWIYSSLEIFFIGKVKGASSIYSNVPCIFWYVSKYSRASI